MLKQAPGLIRGGPGIYPGAVPLRRGLFARRAPDLRKSGPIAASLIFMREHPDEELAMLPPCLE